MLKYELLVKDPEGLHARPAGIIAKAATKYICKISITKNDINKTVDAKRLFSVMGLAVKCGQSVTFTFEGPDEGDANAEFCNICNENRLGDILYQ